MVNIFKKLAKIHKKKPVVVKTWEEYKQDAIKSTKQFIQTKIDELKFRHNYRDLTRHEQYLLGHYVDDWYKDDMIAVIQPVEPNGVSYVIVISLWQPSLETYYVETELLKEDNYDLSEKDKHRCVLLVDEAMIVAQIMTHWQILQANIEYYNTRIEMEKNNVL
jgi:hypothetical protein